MVVDLGLVVVRWLRLLVVVVGVDDLCVGEFRCPHLRLCFCTVLHSQSSRTVLLGRGWPYTGE